MRNVLKQAEIGRSTISIHRDLNYSEMKNIMDIAKTKNTLIDCMCFAITTAFYMGYATGIRAAKSDK